MQKPEARTVITFHTTAEAMAAERLFRELALPGKLITVPRRLTSDCGLAWSAPAEAGGAAEEDQRGQTQNQSASAEILPDAAHEREFYVRARPLCVL